MANTVIRLKKSSVSSHLPTAGQLEHGEIALNYADGKIFYKDPSNNIQQISGSANTFYSVNANGTLLVATSPSDILTINPGNNIEIAGDFLTDTLTVTANLKAAFDIANAAFDRANSSNDVLYVAAAYNTANAAYQHANDVATSANNYAGYMANAANAYAASLTPNLAPAFSQANIAYLVANAAFDKANLAASAATINVGASPPVGVDPGALWWDTIGGRLYIYYTDVDSSQWVETSPSAGAIDYTSLASNVALILQGSGNTYTSNTTYIVDSFSKSQYRTVKYIIQGVSSGNIHSTEVLLTHDNTTPYLTEYATIFTGVSELYSVSANIHSSNVNLIVSSKDANTIIDFYKFAIQARP